MPILQKQTLLCDRHLQQINLCHFAEMMERLASYLDSIDAATDHFEKVKAKMEAGSIIKRPHTPSGHDANGGC